MIDFTKFLVIMIIGYMLVRPTHLHLELKSVFFNNFKLVRILRVVVSHSMKAKQPKKKGIWSPSESKYLPAPPSSKPYLLLKKLFKNTKLRTKIVFF